MLRDVLESGAFRNAKSKVSVALGKNIAGDDVVIDLASMPHLLIAGTTGSGKSVCVNSLIVSLLFKATPEEVKLIMIDPKGGGAVRLQRHSASDGACGNRSLKGGRRLAVGFGGDVATL